jgi:hypothetical protein
VIAKWIATCIAIGLPFAMAATWPTAATTKVAPSDEQIDQVVMAVQGLSTHKQAVLRGREILKGFLYRWGSGQ